MTERKRRRILQRIRKAEMLFAGARDEFVLVNDTEKAKLLNKALWASMLVRCELEDPL